MPASLKSHLLHENYEPFANYSAASVASAASAACDLKHLYIDLPYASRYVITSDANAELVTNLNPTETGFVEDLAAGSVALCASL